VIADEVNVKSVELTGDVAAHAAPVLQVLPAVAGPRLGGDVQKAIRAVKAGDWRQDGDTVVAGGVTLQPGEFTMRLVPADEHASASLAGNDGVVVLDLDVTAELEVEGLARDLVRLVQQARRDRIALDVRAAEPWVVALHAHHDLVAGETLATSVTSTVDPGLAEPAITVSRA
jgi:isoleucyl-tRNA synthetase